MEVDGDVISGRNVKSIAGYPIEVLKYFRDDGGEAKRKSTRSLSENAFAEMQTVVMGVDQQTGKRQSRFEMTDRMNCSR